MFRKFGLFSADILHLSAYFLCSHVYVPVLPAPLLEVLNSPTPFIMGIHISLREQVADLVSERRQIVHYVDEYLN